MGRQLTSLDTLPEDIYALLEGKLVGDQMVLDKFGPRLGEVLSARFRGKQEDRKPTLRMSNIGRPLRQLWYELSGYTGEEICGKTHFKFLYGDLLEALLLVLAEASGHKVERLQEEVEVDGIRGHIDAVIDGELVDVKSCSPFSYSKFKDGSLSSNDPFGYVGQLSGYSEAVGLQARFIAVNKVLGDICTLKLENDGYDIRSRISEVRLAVASSTPPERCYGDVPDGSSGNRKLSIGCSYCNFKHECWKDCNGGTGLQSYLYSTGPRFFTRILKTPRVFPLNNNNNNNNKEEENT